MGTSSDGRLTILFIVGSLIAVTIMMMIFMLPLILTCCERRRRKNSISSDDQSLLLKTRRSTKGKPKKPSNSYHEFTEIDCALEYRTRGTQLIIGVANLVPSSNSWRFLNEITNSKIFLLVYIDGDFLNSPCESTKRDLEEKILFNEIFIFTVMPYDLSSLNLIVHTVLQCGTWKYNIGTLALPLAELDKQSYALNRIYQSQFPSELTLVTDCLLSLSILKSNKTIKAKIGKLYFLDGAKTDWPTTGLNIRIQINDFQNSLEVFNTTKKKFQQCVTFNEFHVFQFDKPFSGNLELEIQLLESFNDTVSEEMSVGGRCVLHVLQDESSKGFGMSMLRDDHLLQVMINEDVEIARWHPLSFVKSTR